MNRVGNEEPLLVSSSSPLVTVLITNYNYGRFLSAAVNGALAQTYSSVEVLVVDDGSSDCSRQVIQSYGARIRPIFKPNGGQTSAFNLGFRESRGDVVIFLDADDVLWPGAVEKIVPLFRAGRVSQVHWPLEEIDVAGQRNGLIRPPIPLSHGNLHEQVLAEGPYACTYPPTSGNAWARWLLQEVFPLPERESALGFGSASADAYLSALAALLGEVRTIAAPQGAYRVHGANDYASLNQRAQLEQYVLRYGMICDGFAEFCRRRGLAVDPAAWRRNDPRLKWAEGWLAADQFIRSSLPAGARVVLADDDQWRASLNQSGCDCRPLVERNGEYWGSPENDAGAIKELERHRAAGAACLIVAPSAFWWREHYPQFFASLRRQFPCPVANDQIIIFDLRPPS